MAKSTKAAPAALSNRPNQRTVSVVKKPFADRREPVTRYLWTGDPLPVLAPPHDRRIDPDVRHVLHQLLTMTQNREIGGLIAGVVRRDGRVDLITAGDAFDYPLVASGLALKVSSFATSLERQPIDGGES